MPTPRTTVLVIGLALLALVPPLATAIGQPFYVDVMRRVMIFAIAAVSLDLILGYGGMVSFGHAAYLGIGAYAVGIPAFYGIHNGYVQWAIAVLASAAAALVIGTV
jgi:branched-chain amino acid transport system permease protein